MFFVLPSFTKDQKRRHFICIIWWGGGLGWEFSYSPFLRYQLHSFAVNQHFVFPFSYSAIKMRPKDPGVKTCLLHLKPSGCTETVHFGPIAHYSSTSSPPSPLKLLILCLFLGNNVEKKCKLLVLFPPVPIDMQRMKSCA